MPSKIAGQVWIEDIINGEFVKSEGYEPNILRTKYGEEYERVRVMGTIVEKLISEEGDYVAITLDDSTETIRAKVFKDDVKKFKNLKEGDLVDIIGELREYDNEIYIHPRGVQKLVDPNWELLRNFEILQRRMKPKVEGASEEKKIGVLEQEEVLKALKALDDGSGVSFEVLLKNLKEYNKEDVVEVLKTLLSRGDVFEPKKEVYKLV